MNLKLIDLLNIDEKFKEKVTFTRDDYIFLIILNIIFCLSYFVLGYCTASLFSAFGIFPAPFWLSASVALIASMLSPRLFLIGIFSGSFLTNHVLFSATLSIAILVSIGNAISASIGAILLKKYANTNMPFYKISDVILFVTFGLFLHGGIAAFGGILSMYLFTNKPVDILPIIWLKWTVSDAVGCLFLTPLVMLWLDEKSKENINKIKDNLNYKISSRIDLLIVYVTALSLIFLTFFIIGDQFNNSYLGALFFIIPPLIWLGIKFSTAHSWVLFSCLFLIATVGTFSGFGPFFMLSQANKIVSLELLFLGVAFIIFLTGSLSTERRQALNELEMINKELENKITQRTSELERLMNFQQSLIDSLPNPVFYKNTEGLYLGSNQAYANYLQIPKDSIINRTAKEVLLESNIKNIEDIGEIIRRVDNEVLENKINVSSVEISLEYKNSNKKQYALYYKNPIYDNHQELIGTVGVLIDITKRKETELRLSQSEELFRIVAEMSPFSLVMSRLQDHKIIYANKQSYSMFNTTAKKMIGNYAPALYVNPIERIKIAEQIQITRQPIRDVEILCRRFGSSSSENFWGLLSATPTVYQGQEILIVALNNINERKLLEEKLRIFATIDSLTQIANRRYFMEQSQNYFEFAKINDLKFCFIMIDIDRFKQINDNYGHANGDEVIRTLATIINEFLTVHEKIDNLIYGKEYKPIFGRLGGEEFAILLPHIEITDGLDIAEDIRKLVEMYEIKLKDNSIKFLNFTISLGITEYQKIFDKSLEQIMSRADKALYVAKNQGRNQVVKF